MQYFRTFGNASLCKHIDIKSQFLLIRGIRDESYESFKQRIFDTVNPIALSPDIKGLKATITEERPPATGVIPLRKDKIAAVRVDSANGIDLPDDTPGLAGTYLVEEAQPVSYTRDWPQSERTPGICLLTLFRKKKSIDRETFLDRWHNGHTPLSLEIHPLWHYSRNVVIESNGSHYDGIVEEHCRTRSEMLNPVRFFGGPLRMLPNMIRVYSDVKGFLDYGSIEPYMVSEYYLVG